MIFQIIKNGKRGLEKGEHAKLARGATTEKPGQKNNPQKKKG